jgi:AAA domain
MSEAAEKLKPRLKRCRRTGCDGVIPPNKITCIACGGIDFGAASSSNGRVDDGIQRLSEITERKQERLLTGLCDRNFGSAQDPGLAVTSVTLLGGGPGAGKSTLCAQILSNCARASARPGLYVGAEENGGQVKDRAIRLLLPNLDDMLILSLESQSQGYKINREVFARWKPGIFVLDSIQKYARSDAEQIELAADLKEVSTEHKCPVIIISQVNKEEEFAGSNGLQHEVDALVIFSTAESLVTPSGREIFPPLDPENPDKIEPFRILRTKKNRNGDSYESYFVMDRLGLHPFLLPAGSLARPKVSEEPTTKDEDDDDADDEDDEDGED